MPIREPEVLKMVWVKSKTLQQCVYFYKLYYTWVNLYKRWSIEELLDNSFFSFQNDMRLVWKCRWNETFTRTLRITENIEKRRRKQTLCCMLYFEGVKGKVKIILPDIHWYPPFVCAKCCPYNPKNVLFTPK